MIPLRMTMSWCGISISLRAAPRRSARAPRTSHPAGPPRAPDRVDEGPEGVGVERPLERDLAQRRQRRRKVGGDGAADREQLGDRVPRAGEQVELALDPLAVDRPVAG